MTDKQIEKLVDDIKQSIATTHDLVLKLERAVKGENPIGQAIAYWCTSWKGKHGATYEMTKGDVGQFKKWVNSVGLGEFCTRLNRYLNDHDRWLVEQKHPLSVFYKRVNTYASRDITSDESPVDCQHEPPCRTDTEHTRRRNQEMRT